MVAVAARCATLAPLFVLRSPLSPNGITHTWLALSAAGVALLGGCSGEGPSLPEPGDGARGDERPDDLTDEQQELFAALEAIGYLDGEVDAAPDSATGVTIHDAARAQAGYNLVVSAHRPEALLMDMEGAVLHRWSKSFADVWPQVVEREPGKRDHPNARHWRRAFLFENGDLLAIYEGLGIVKLDRDSEVVWKRYNGAHHDLDVMPDGTIYLLTRHPRVLERIHATKPVLEDFVTVLDADGALVRSVSLLECFEGSDAYRHLWDESAKRHGDIFHTNTIEVLDDTVVRRAPAFRAGRILTSMYALNAIAVVDLELREVVWAHTGTFRGQHDPQITAQGGLLLFDNQPDERASRVLEFDPANLEVLWSYAGTPEAPFFSRRCGAVQRLPSGNTLIAESMHGRALEVTPDGELVWEYRNPERVRDGARVAQLFDVVRLAPDFPTDWAGR